MTVSTGMPNNNIKESRQRAKPLSSCTCCAKRSYRLLLLGWRPGWGDAVRGISSDRHIFTGCGGGGGDGEL